KNKTMINTDKNHKHIYDAQGKQLCCTQEEKIYTKAGAKSLIQNDDCCSTKKQAHEEHSDDDGHDHSGGNDSVFKMFLPAVISLILLLTGIALDNWFPQTWFTGWIRIILYVLAYIPVGVPV